MEQAIEEQLFQPVGVEEAHITAHPLEAPPAAHSEADTDADRDQTHQADENEENTTTE